MTLNYRFHIDAAKELADAIDYYNICSEGLGAKFLTEVTKGIDNILSYPQAWQKISQRTRRYLLNNFPYGLIYSHEKNMITILAVMNLKKEPKYWVTRH